MEKEQWGTIAAIVYFSLYALLLLLIAIHVHVNDQPENKKTFLSSIWKRRGIYGQILVHLYDTATDIGVLVQWYFLAQQEKSGGNIESLDMNGLFWISIAFLILYRVISILIALASSRKARAGCSELLLDIFLAIIDMYIIKAVYQAIKGEAKEPTLRQKMIQLTEAVFESLPQVVLQSVFIIRWFNHSSSDSDTQTMALVGMSLLASVFSISNKYSWIDREACDDEDYKEAKISKKCPVVNPYYVLRIIWRYSYVITRFAMISLLWSVLGGVFVAICLPISWLLWFATMYLDIVIIGDNSVTCVNIMVLGLMAIVCMVATPATDSKWFAIAHAFEVLVTMSIITWFSFDPSINCGICADPQRRQAMNNPYIRTFIITAWIAMVVDFITYIIILCIPLFDDEGWDALLDMYAEGVNKAAARR
eukprot:256299_1